MTTDSQNKLYKLWQFFSHSTLTDILFVGALVEDEGILVAERIVGRNPIYLKFQEHILEIYSVENDKGCELHWRMSESVNLPPPVYEDDPDEDEFRYVLYSVFSVVAPGSPTNVAYMKAETGAALLESSDQNIVRGLDIGFSSGIVCRFDPCTFDGLQLHICAGHPGDGFDSENKRFLIVRVNLSNEI